MVSEPRGDHEVGGGGGDTHLTGEGAYQQRVLRGGGGGGRGEGGGGRGERGVCYIEYVTIIITVEPPNKGHLGTRASVLYSEVSFIRRLEVC